MNRGFLNSIPAIPKPLEGEVMKCPHCFHVMVIVTCHHCGQLCKVPMNFPL